MKKSVEIIVSDKKYVLAYTVPNIEKIADYKEWTLEVFILGEPNCEVF